MHIELRRWADVLVIAPLSANTLAKLAQGMADSLLACVVRAWDFNKPLLVCACKLDACIGSGCVPCNAAGASSAMHT